MSALKTQLRSIPGLRPLVRKLRRITVKYPRTAEAHRIEYTGNLERKCLRSDSGSMDLFRAISEIPPVRMGEGDTHVLRLGDRS